MRLVLLSNGKGVQVSDQDFALVAHRHWWQHYDRRDGKYYAYTHDYYRDETGKTRKRKIYMHRVITGCPSGFLVDHWDNDGLNNQRWNLRIALNAQNQANHAQNCDNICGYRGVSRAGRSSYRARIQVAGAEIYLGAFDTMRGAAEAYDRAALQHYGAFAWLNFDERQDQEMARRAEEQALLAEDIPF